MTDPIVVHNAADLYRALRAEWIRSGVTLREISTEVQWSGPSHVSKALAGQKDVKLAAAIRLARALHYRVVLVRDDAS